MAKKIPWHEKYEKIKSSYPESLDIDWSTAMRRDPDLFVKIIGDVIKSEGRGSKPGKRPNLSRAEAEEKYQQIAGLDFSEHDFNVAFKALGGSRSIRNISSKTGLGKSYVARLLADEANPSFETMERIAEGFKKSPSYFLEYRVAFVLAVIEEYLSDSPETATAWYMKLRGRR